MDNGQVRLPVRRKNGHRRVSGEGTVIPRKGFLKPSSSTPPTPFIFGRCSGLTPGCARHSLLVVLGIWNVRD